MPANNDWLDQFEEGKSAGGHAGAVAAIPRAAVSTASPRMTSRRFPAPWRADPMPGGYVVRDANGQALAYVYCRDNEAEARRIGIKFARLSELLGEADRDRAIDSAAMN